MRPTRVVDELLVRFVDKGQLQKEADVVATPDPGRENELVLFPAVTGSVVQQVAQGYPALERVGLGPHLCPPFIFRRRFEVLREELGNGLFETLHEPLPKGNSGECGENTLRDRLDVVGRILSSTVQVGLTHQCILSENQQAQERLQGLGVAIGRFQLSRIHRLRFGS